jgi:hypothetical protein
MGIISVESGTQAATIGTEHTLNNITTGIGVYVLTVDTTPMVLGDILQIFIKTKVTSGSSFVVAYKISYSDAQEEANKYSVPVPVASGLGIICTLKQTNGTGKSFVWNLLRA